jgi:hypothetical protein
VVFCIAAGQAWAADRKIEDFYGEYVGQTISETDRGLNERDIAVSIKAIKKGFEVGWTTTIPKPGGEASRKSYKIKFQKSKRANIYAAGMRPNYFGGWVPLDPMKSEPYIWARIKEATLTVYAMHVIDDGSYEMQTYDRTLTKEGMRLDFTRIRADGKVKKISGVLKRMKK